MLKNDLRTGMVVEFRDGVLGTVLLDTSEGDIISGNTWVIFEEMSDDLKCDDGFNEDADIVKVYQPQNAKSFLNWEDINWCKDMKLLWERK